MLREVFSMLSVCYYFSVSIIRLFWSESRVCAQDQIYIVDYPNLPTKCSQFFPNKVTDSLVSFVSNELKTYIYLDILSQPFGATLQCIIWVLFRALHPLLYTNLLHTI